MQLRRKEMEFETLKKSHKKQVILGALAVVLVGSAITFVTTRAKYKLTQDINIASGTINYKPYDFKVMAMYLSEDGTNYTEITGRMPSSGYVINESKSYCTLDNKNKDTSAVLKTINGNHVISNLAKSDKCYLYFDKKTSIDNAFELLAKVQSEAKTTTPTFSTIATTDEGVFKVADGMYGGTSYYWRGAVTNNYIMFANFCWRIIRINGDGSIRLIYDGTTCHANGTSTVESIAKTNVAYNSSYNNSSYVGWTYTASSQRPSGSGTGTSSNAKTQLELWYSANIASYASNIADGKYCNDRDADSGSTWSATDSNFNYAAYGRIYSTNTPTLSCPISDTYTLKVGLITADEAMFAGAAGTSANASYYLYNGQDYWTMSPYNFRASTAYVFFVQSSGKLYSWYTDEARGLRPVINLKSDVTFSGGTGTQSNPYVVS